MARRIAILGGRIGAEHLDGYLVLPDRFQVASICDIDSGLAHRLAARAPGARATGDLASVLSDPAIDVVDICLPPALHVSVSLDAIRAGKHVICEKPVAGCLFDAERVKDVAEDRGRLWVPVFQYRFGTGIAALQRLKSEGLLGKPLVGTLETHWDRGEDYYRNPWRGTRAGEFAGVVLNHAIHIHDLVMEVFGPVTEVSAALDTRTNAIETEDCAAIWMKTASGGLVTSSVTLGAQGNTSRLRLVFERLTAESGHSPYAPGEAGWSFVTRSRENRVRVDRIVDEVDRSHLKNGYEGLFDTVADRLDGIDCALPSPGDGVRSIELASAIYEAAHTGCRVTLPIDRDLPVCRNLMPNPPS